MEWLDGQRSHWPAEYAIGVLEGESFADLAAHHIVRVQDVGLSGADDLTILQWAAEQGRILLTHAEWSTDGKWEGQVRYLPLR